MGIIKKEVFIFRINLGSKLRRNKLKKFLLRDMRILFKKERRRSNKNRKLNIRWVELFYKIKKNQKIIIKNRI